MGKAQYKKKTAEKRHNPIRVPDAHLGSGKVDGKVDSEKERQMIPVMAKLRSAEYADRTWACAAICNLISGDPATRRMFQGKNVVGELVERLSDSVDEVVVEASGALRNLAIDGGHELCAEMYNKGIMPHLSTLMGKITGTIDGVLAANTKDLSDSELQARKHLLNLTENVISLVWSLADANHKTLAAVNSAGCQGLLVKVLQGRDALSVGVVLAAAQALYSLTQDNWDFTKALQFYPGAIETLVTMARKDHTQAEKDLKGKGKGKAEDAQDDEIGDGRVLLTRVLVVGTLRNVVLPDTKMDKNVGIAQLTNDTFLPLVNSLLDVNLGNVVQRVTELVAQVPQESVPVAGKNLATDHRSPAEVKLERVERMLVTVVTALEVLTGICAGLEDIEEEAMDEDGMKGDDDEELGSDDADMEDAMADEELIARGRDPHDATGGNAAPAVNAGSLQHLFGTLALPARLAPLTQLTPLSFPPTGAHPSLHPPTTAVLSSMHLRALEALNNLLVTACAALASPSPSADLVALAAALPAQSLWDSLFATVAAAGEDAAALSARGQEMRREVLEAALAAAWGVVKAHPQLNPGAATQMLIDVLPALSSDAARARAIDTLASVAARPGVPVDENQRVGAFLTSALGASASAEVTVALLNGIIDMYADETREYDAPVFVAGKYTDILAGSVARVRAQVRGVDKRKAPELRVRGEETYENLVAFIKYRRSL